MGGREHRWGEGERVDRVAQQRTADHSLPTLGRGSMLGTRFTQTPPPPGTCTKIDKVW